MLSPFLLLYLPVFLPLRCCPSWRSFTTWRTETLIMSTWPSLFCSSSQRMIPSIAPSMRWWVDTILMHLSLFVHCCCILSLFSPVGQKHAWRFYKPYPRVTYLFYLTGTEEHFMVHGEIVDGDLTRQLAHPGGHPHHPVQHDANKGRFVTSRVKSTTVEQYSHLQVIISKK